MQSWSSTNRSGDLFYVKRWCYVRDAHPVFLDGFGEFLGGIGGNVAEADNEVLAVVFFADVLGA